MADSIPSVGSRRNASESTPKRLNSTVWRLPATFRRSPGQSTFDRGLTRALHPPGMDDARSGRLVRVLRQRRGWRQADLAGRAGLGRTVVSDLERGQIDGTSLATVRKIVGAFGLSAELVIHGLGADMDRVLDERHAALLGAVSKWLRGLGWTIVAEVSYSEWGERGSVDLLCWHGPTATLLVVEVKTELASVEATLRKHDEKGRLGPKLAQDRFGWRPQAIGRLLVFPDDRRERAGLRHTRRCWPVPIRSVDTTRVAGAVRPPDRCQGCCSYRSVGLHAPLAGVRDNESARRAALLAPRRAPDFVDFPLPGTVPRTSALSDGIPSVGSGPRASESNPKRPNLTVPRLPATFRRSPGAMTAPAARTASQLTPASASRRTAPSWSHSTRNASWPLAEASSR